MTHRSGHSGRHVRCLGARPGGSRRAPRVATVAALLAAPALLAGVARAGADELGVARSGPALESLRTAGQPPVPGLARAAPGPVPAEPIRPDTLELMRVAGLDDEVRRAARELASALTGGFAAADPDGDAARLRTAARVAARLVSVERVHDAVARRVQAALDRDARARLLAFDRSGLGREARAAERAPGAFDAERIERFVAEARGRPAFDARLETLTALVAETGLDALEARRASDLELAALHGALVADPAGAGPEVHERLDELDWHRGIARFVLGRELPKALARAYASLTDVELGILLEAARGGERRRLLAALGEGLHDAARAAVEALEPRYRAALRGAGIEALAAGARVPDDPAAALPAVAPTRRGASGSAEK